MSGGVVGSEGCDRKQFKDSGSVTTRWFKYDRDKL